MQLDRSRLTPELRFVVPAGRVILRILVRADGSVALVEIASTSGHPVLDEAALERAASWRFRPATRDGVPIDAWAIVPVRFTLP